jgi:hypothetical protein
MFLLTTDIQSLTGVAMENHSSTIKGECMALLNQILNLLNFSHSRDKADMTGDSLCGARRQRLHWGLVRRQPELVPGF